MNADELTELRDMLLAYAEAKRKLRDAQHAFEAAKDFYYKIEEEAELAKGRVDKEVRRLTAAAPVPA